MRHGVGGPRVASRAGVSFASPYGEIGYTASRKPFEFLWSDEFAHIDDAIAFEKKVKGWSRAKKEALMRGD